MQVLVGLLVVALIVGSPIWTTALVALLPHKYLPLAFAICAIQALLAYWVWWFFWGGGIGGELHPPESCRYALLFALMPVVKTVSRFCGYP